MAASLARASVQEPAERIISLLWLLLHSPRGYTRGELRRLVVGYEGLSDAAFEKLFQRDRRALRAVGVPLLLTQPEPTAGEGEDGGARLRVDRDALLLRDVDFTLDERRALVRARRLWAESPLRADVVRAVGLLFHPGEVDRDETLAGFHALMPRVDPRLAALTEATAEGRAVRFGYRDAAGSLTDRRVRPWFLTLARGSWYLTGWDLGRAAERSFRLTRMEAGPTPLEGASEAPGAPAGYDALGLRTRLAGAADAERLRVWLTPGRGQAVRVAGERVTPGPADGPAPEAGWELWEAPARVGADGLAAEVSALLGAALFSPASPEAARGLAADLDAAARLHAGEPDPAWEGLTLTPPVRRRTRDSSEDLVGRLLDIVGLANRADGVERGELRERLGVTDAELDRDLDMLQYCGMPEREFPGFLFEVEETDGRIHVLHAAELEAPVRLTRPEAQTLVGALQTVADMTVLDDADRAAARSAQRRIQASLLAAGEPPDPDGAGLDPETAALLGADHDAGAADPGVPSALAAHWDVVVDPETVRLLLAAIAEHAVVRLRYHAVRTDAESVRDVEPLAVVQDRTLLYLHAWCRLARGPRVFRVDRISALERTGETFAPRPGPADRRVRPEADAADVVETVLRWDHRIRDAADGYRPLAQAHLPSGDRVTRVALAGPDVAAALVGRHAGAVEVLAPADLRADVHARAAKAARQAAAG